MHAVSLAEPTEVLHIPRDVKNTLLISAADRKDRALQHNGADRRYQQTRATLVNAKPASNHFLPKTKEDNITYLLTLWSRVLFEKLIGSAASEEIPRILRNPNVNYSVYKCPSLVSILSEITLVHAPPLRLPEDPS